MAYSYPVYPSAVPIYQPVPVCRYQIREKIFSIGDAFKIKDELGRDVFTVRSKIFSIGNKLALEDITGK
jgi:uncharacterized protein YxjI